MRAIGLVMMVLAGCLQPAAQLCATGAVCPAGLRCTVVGSTELCVLPTCGDGKPDRGEACDDGNNVSGDGCPADCRPPCGDGMRDPDEVCDDGNTVGGDGCAADCGSTETCTGSDCDPGGGSGAPSPPMGRWQPVYASPGAGPAALAYDEARRVVVLFKPSDSGAASETWDWDGATWGQRNPATLPSVRTGAAMAYDGAHERVVLFGGTGGDRAVWQWDGRTWAAIAAAGPPSLVGHAMAYDAGRRRVILFGGATADGTRQDRTWAWDGEAWQALTTSGQPPARAGHAMAYDPTRGIVVMIGGDAADAGQVWELEGTTWRVRAPAAGPPAHDDVALAYDAARGELVAFAGGDGGPAPTASTWSWNGVRWGRIGSQLAPPGPRAQPALASDVVRNKLVMFGGRRQPADGPGGLDDTWELDSDRGWRGRAATAPAPGPRQRMAAVYDPFRNNVLLFGGAHLDDAAAHAGIGLDADTWRWDGFTWSSDLESSEASPPRRAGAAIASSPNSTLIFGGIGPGGALLADTWDRIAGWRLQPGAAPPARASATMTFDSGRHVFVLFGGVGASGALDDTWEQGEFGIRTWAPSVAMHRPPARSGHAMAYDSARHRVLVFGGALRDDTWAWDGVDWSARPTAVRPPARDDTAMVYDAVRDRVVLFGGRDASHSLADTWEWDGAAWQPRDPVGPIPPARHAHAMTFDPQRGRVVMIGGGSDSGALDDVWEWDGTTWRDVSSAPSVPSARSDHAMVYDPEIAGVVMFGGLASAAGPVLRDTWEWNGSEWRQRIDFQLARAGHALALGVGTSPLSLVLFGGDDGAGGLFGDTWEWEGGWQDVHPFARPGPRAHHAMVYDGTTTSTMLFGGRDEGGVLGDQWQWPDTHDWIQVRPSVLPPARTDFALAYDSARNRVVLFGGQGKAGLLDDVWEWDGTTWTERTPQTAAAPAPRAGHTMAYHEQRGRVLLFGGRSHVGALNDVWEWDGTTWTALPIALRSPPPRDHHAMVYDASRAELVMYGGRDAAGGALRDSWVFRYGDQAGQPAHCDYDGVCGVDESCGTCADCDDCRTCGDDVCGATESCSTCPGDCGGCP